jgi:hypothetical protein
VIFPTLNPTIEQSANAFLWLASLWDVSGGWPRDCIGFEMFFFIQIIFLCKTFFISQMAACADFFFEKFHIGNIK